MTVYMTEKQIGEKERQEGKDGIRCTIKSALNSSSDNGNTKEGWWSE
jgi:hypothetical protein